MKIRCEFTVVSLGIGLPSREVESLTFNAHGIVEDNKHFGPTLISGPRVRKGAPVVPAGEIDENWRMFSAISVEDFRVIKEQYEQEYNRKLDELHERYLGANIILKGIKNFSLCTTGSVLDFYDGPTLCVSSENTSCKTPGKFIAQDFDLPVSEARKFVGFANGYRGVVGKVLKGGVLRQGMKGVLYEPGF